MASYAPPLPRRPVIPTALGLSCSSHCFPRKEYPTGAFSLAASCRTSLRASRQPSPPKIATFFAASIISASLATEPLILVHAAGEQEDFRPLFLPGPPALVQWSGAVLRGLSQSNVRQNATVCIRGEPLSAGSPPWIMKSGITRWKMVPSYSLSVALTRVVGCDHSRLPSARSMKFLTVMGASASKRRTVILPSVVEKIA